MKSLWKKIKDFFGWSNTDEAPKLNNTEIKDIVKDAVDETGTGDYIRKLVATKDPAEREKLHKAWEAKMEERKGRSIL